MAAVEEQIQAGGAEPMRHNAHEKAYSLNNGAVLIVRTEDYGNGSGHISAAIGSLHNMNGPIQLSGADAMKKLRDILTRHVPFTLAEINAMVPVATVKELTK